MPDTSQDPVGEAPRTAGPARRTEAVSPPFRCVCVSWGIDAAWVKAFGDLDLAGVPDLEAVLRAPRAPGQLILLDLSGLSFIDLVGVRAITDASIEASYAGRRLIVAFAPPATLRAFALTGTAEAVEWLDLERSDQSAGPGLRPVEPHGPH